MCQGTQIGVQKQTYMVSTLLLFSVLGDKTFNENYDIYDIDTIWYNIWYDMVWWYDIYGFMITHTLKNKKQFMFYLILFLSASNLSTVHSSTPSH